LNGKGVGKTGVFPWRSSRTAGFVGANENERREIPLPRTKNKTLRPKSGRFALCVSIQLHYALLDR